MYRDDLILSSSRGNTAEPNPEVTGLLSLVRTEVHCPEILAYATVLINELKDQVLKQQVHTFYHSAYNIVKSID